MPAIDTQFVYSAIRLTIVFFAGVVFGMVIFSLLAMARQNDDRLEGFEARMMRLDDNDS